jgi:hypothetical protein
MTLERQTWLVLTELCKEERATTRVRILVRLQDGKEANY